MAENNASNTELIKQLVARLDEEYRLRRSAESRLAELSDAAAMKESYERLFIEKDKQIAEKDSQLVRLRTELGEKTSEIKQIKKDKLSELKAKDAEVEKLPMEPLAKSYAGASILTEITVGKYNDHIPFYRQIQMFKRLGIDIPQSTIESWFHGVADLMRPLYYTLEEKLLSLDYLESDETTIPIINKEKKRAVKGYLWLARSVLHPMVIFHYHEGSRNSKVAVEFFKNFKGALQVDGYAGYDVIDKFDGIIILCCWAHAKRYYDRSLSTDKERAEYAISQIDMLYSIESMADEKNLTYEQRALYRQQYAYPIIRALEAWALTEYPKVLPKSPIGKGLHYTVSRIRQLSRYTLDGRYRIDNNLVENAVRPVAVGRKGYLFCGNHDAAEDAAVIYSFMGCCKQADVDPKKWTAYFLNHVHDYDTDYTKDLAELLPHNLKTQGLV